MSHPALPVRSYYLKKNNLHKKCSMSHLTIPVKFDLDQFLQFFSQLSPENKMLIFNALKETMQAKPAKSLQDSPLKGSVLSYQLPFDAVAENDWEAVK